MKECPKCGADNRPDSSICYNCFTYLEGVPVTEAPSQQPQAPQGGPVQPNGAPSYFRQTPGPIGQAEEHGEEPVSVVGQPLGSQQNQPPPVYGPQPAAPHTYARKGEYRRPEPIKSSNLGSIIGMILLLLMLFGGGGFAYWKFIYTPGTPVNVIRSLFKANQASDTDKVKLYFTKKSLEKINFAETGINNLSNLEGLKNVKEGEDYLIEFSSSDKTKSTVRVKFTPSGIDKIMKNITGLIPEVPLSKQQAIKDMLKVFFESGIPYVLIKEEDKWKVDIDASNEARMKAVASILKLGP